MSVEVDVWVRGTLHASTHRIDSLPEEPNQWDDDDVRRLVSEMLLALEREKNPGGERPTVTLRGFSWIVSPYEAGGVLIHVEMQIGTASAGPINIDEGRLTATLQRIISTAEPPGVIH
jgi:hypothetical protein